MKCALPHIKSILVIFEFVELNIGKSLVSIFIFRVRNQYLRDCLSFKKLSDVFFLGFES